MAGQSVEPESGGEAARQLYPGMRPLLIAFSVLTVVATNQLYFLADHTDSYFAWTIRPSLSAAFLGAGYAAGAILVLSSVRVKTWAEARLPVLTVLLFTLLTLAATLLSIGRFHLGSDGLIARFAAWFWLAVYLVVPTWMLWLLVQQRRFAYVQTGIRPQQPPPIWLRLVLALQGAVLVAVGVTLFVAPSTHRSLWAWQLTPLTARTIAAWMISFGLAAWLAAAERDLWRVRIAAFAYAFFAALQLASLARYRHVVDWSKPATITYVIVLGTIVITGLAGYWLRPKMRS
jgi:hypothetical protein